MGLHINEKSLIINNYDIAGQTIVKETEENYHDKKTNSLDGSGATRLKVLKLVLFLEN